jgi:hypothetical protein
VWTPRLVYDNRVRKKHTMGMCVYCNDRPAVDKEHVFARCLFSPKPNPAITVPSCKECNAGKGDGIDRNMNLDEDYFRTFLCANKDCSDHPAAMELINGPIRRIFDRSPKLRAPFEPHEFQVIGDSGNVSFAPAFHPQYDRIERVLRKITRGLCYHFNVAPLPREYELRVKSRVSHDPSTVGKYIDKLAGFRPLEPLRLGQADTVRCYGTNHPQDKNKTMFLMVFYGGYAAMTMTWPKGDAPSV